MVGDHSVRQEPAKSADLVVCIDVWLSLFGSLGSTKHAEKLLCLVVSGHADTPIVAPC